MRAAGLYIRGVCVCVCLGPGGGGGGWYAVSPEAPAKSSILLLGLLILSAHSAYHGNRGVI